MSHDNDCGHSEEEHEAEAKEMQAAVMSGDFGPIFQLLPHDLLAKNMKSLFIELFVRSENDESFLENIHSLTQEAEMLLVDGVDPEVRETVLEMREMFGQQIEANQFENEAVGEIEQMLDTYGVIPDAPVAAVAPKDEGIGQYL